MSLLSLCLTAQGVATTTSLPALRQAASAFLSALAAPPWRASCAGGLSSLIATSFRPIGGWTLVTEPSAIQVS